MRVPSLCGIGLALLSAAIAMEVHADSAITPDHASVGSGRDPTGAAPAVGTVPPTVPASADYAQDYAYGADDRTPNVMLGHDNGNPALTVANRTKGSTSMNAPAGMMAFGFDDTPAAANTWAIYDEVRRYPDVATAAVVNEANATDLSGKAGLIDPYALAYSRGNLVAGIYIQSGGGCTAQTMCFNPRNRRFDLLSSPASVALNISNNGATFYSGINFANNALQGNDGKSDGGYAAALRMPRGDSIEQDFCSDTEAYPSKCGPLALGSYLLFEVDNPADVIKAHLSDSGFLLTNAANQVLFQVDKLDTSHADGVAIDAASASSPDVTIRSQGGDKNVPLVLSAKGNSPVTIGSGFLRVARTTIAALRALDESPQAGDTASVSDAITCQADRIVEGGGSLSCAVIYSGADWRASVTH